MHLKPGYGFGSEEDSVNEHKRQRTSSSSIPYYFQPIHLCNLGSVYDIYLTPFNSERLGSRKLGDCGGFQQGYGHVYQDVLSCLTAISLAGIHGRDLAAAIVAGKPAATI
jgi:hypothetical protein